MCGCVKRIRETKHVLSKILHWMQCPFNYCRTPGIFSPSCHRWTELFLSTIIWFLSIPLSKWNFSWPSYMWDAYPHCTLVGPELQAVSSREEGLHWTTRCLTFTRIKEMFAEYLKNKCRYSLLLGLIHFKMKCRAKAITTVQKDSNCPNQCDIWSQPLCTELQLDGDGSPDFLHLMPQGLFVCFCVLGG